MNKLAIVAITGITLSAVCLGAGGALEGRDLKSSFGEYGLVSIFSDRPRCETTGATAASRTLNWDGSDHAGVSIPGHVTWTRGSGDQVHVSGDPELVSHVRIREGSVELDCRNWHGSRDLAVTLPGREFRRFGIAGSGNLTLNALDQDRLNLSIAGSGSIKAEGKVGDTELHIAGSGDINAAQVQGEIVKVHIAGSGNTDIAPTQEADIHIAGSGDVNLHSDPKKLETHIAGAGRIHNMQNRTGG